MNTQPENDLRRAYERFDQNHARLREALLKDLQAASIESRPTLGLMRWRARPWVLGLAASLVVSLACWMVVFFRSPAAAYGVADIPNHLAACQSVRVDGWTEINDVRYPLHYYVEAGRFFWETSLSGENGRVFTGYSVSDSQHYLAVSDRNHTATYGKQDPLLFELVIQQVLQIGLPERLLGPDRRGFVKTGESTLDGAHMLVYQQQSAAGRRLMWLNPATGVPARLQFFEPGPDGRERQTAQWNVATNVARPSALPALNPPAGYSLIRHDRQPRDRMISQAAIGSDETFELLCHLNLEGRAILLCWRHYNRTDGAAPATKSAEAVGSPQPLDFRSLDGRRKYLALHLHDDPWTDGHDAHWSLLIPEDGGQVDRVQITLARPTGMTRMDFLPLRFDDRDKLARLVAQMQQVTLPEGTAPMDLRQLEALTQNHAHH